MQEIAFTYDTNDFALVVDDRDGADPAFQE
jgi:hypothetical protein